MANDLWRRIQEAKKAAKKDERVEIEADFIARDERLGIPLDVGATTRRLIATLPDPPIGYWYRTGNGSAMMHWRKKSTGPDLWVMNNAIYQSPLAVAGAIGCTVFADWHDVRYGLEQAEERGSWR